MTNQELNRSIDSTDCFTIDALKLASDLRLEPEDTPKLSALLALASESPAQQGHFDYRPSTRLVRAPLPYQSPTIRWPGSIGKRVRPTPETLARNAMSLLHRGLRMAPKGAKGRVVDVLPEGS